MFRRPRKYVEEAKPDSDEKEIIERAQKVLTENRKQLKRANNILESEIRRIDGFLT